MWAQRSREAAEGAWPAPALLAPGAPVLPDPPLGPDVRAVAGAKPADDTTMTITTNANREHEKCIEVPSQASEKVDLRDLLSSFVTV